MNDLRVYTNNVDHVIASSPEDAIAVWQEYTGYSWPPDDYEKFALEWTEVPSWSSITVQSGRSQTAGAWINERGRGWLTSTEWEESIT